MEMGRSFLSAFGIAALFALILSPTFNTFADGRHRVPSKVKSAKKVNGKCKGKNVFEWQDEVYAKGNHFPPLTNVDIYVRPNQKWTNGTRIGNDVTFSGPETVATDSNGRLPCTKIWSSPLPRGGKYDIIVDANQDGTYRASDGDAVDRKGKKHGLKIK